MRLTAMRFKDYTWPHNPEIYTVENRRRVAVHKTALGSCVFQELGVSYQVLRGEGAFTGRKAYEQFQRLEEVFRSAGPGQLIHPVWKARRAYFVSLKLTEEPLPDYVRYRFEFWEEPEERGLPSVSILDPEPADGGGSGGGTGQGSGVYVVRKGDTLWGIAKRWGVTLKALIAANPQIKNPNLIYPGNEVRIP